jgi:hypothetical protein
MSLESMKGINAGEDPKVTVNWIAKAKTKQFVLFRLVSLKVVHQIITFNNVYLCRANEDLCLAEIATVNILEYSASCLYMFIDDYTRILSPDTSST